MWYQIVHMIDRSPRTAIFALAVLLCCAPHALSSQISLSNQTAAPGSSILFPMTFAAQGASVSGVQLDLEYDGTNLSLAATVGDALRQSGKNLSTVDLASNHKRILIVGPNQNQIPDGTLFNLFVNVSAAAPQGLYSLKILSIVGTSPNGQPSLVLGTSGILTVDTSAPITPLQPNGVLNAASFIPGPVAPGEIVTLIGSGIGQLAGTSVQFDGIPAPLLFVAPNQINAVVPYSIYGKSSTAVTVIFQNRIIAGISLNVGQTAPAIFTANSTGVGQAAILNQDFTTNSPANPAEKGSVVALFATGAGQTNPPGQDGQLASGVLAKPLLPVAVWIGGIDAEVQYAGAAPGQISGVLQVNAKIPQSASSGAAVPIELTIGKAGSPAGVSIAIK
jgi:uncharacterized protein (TIGR03437 family)